MICYRACLTDALFLLFMNEVYASFDKLPIPVNFQVRKAIHADNSFIPIIYQQPLLNCLTYYAQAFRGDFINRV